MTKFLNKQYELTIPIKSDFIEQYQEIINNYKKELKSVTDSYTLETYIAAHENNLLINYYWDLIQSYILYHDSEDKINDYMLRTGYAKMGNIIKQHKIERNKSLEACQTVEEKENI